ncbi:MAG: glycosyltransferase [Pseudomonadota bacterium]
MRKVLHVFKLYYPEKFGGVQRAIYDIAEGTVDYGYASTVFALSKKPNSDGFDVGRHDAVTFSQQAYIASTGFSIPAAMAFRKHASEADIIHYHFPWPFMDILHSTLNAQKPTIITYHSDIVKQGRLLRLYKPLMHRFLKSADRIIATSPNYLQSSRVLQRYSEKTTVIPLAMPADEQPCEPSIVEKWRAKVGEGYFLFLGALRYYKGLDTLISVARTTGLPIVIAGTGRQSHSLKAYAPENVRFIGHYTDKDRAALLSLAHAFVFPSNRRSEAFGMSLLEAARASLPLICCEIGTGTTFVNKHEETGLVVPPNDPNALADAMRRLDNDHGLAKRLGNNARARFLQHFTTAKTSNLYAQTYEDLLSTHGQTAAA